MKTRNGFVSNSSSSSFLLIGTDWAMFEFLEKDGLKFYGYYDPQVTVEQVRGCQHSLPRCPDAKCCAECGAPLWKTETTTEDVKWDWLPYGSRSLPDTDFMYFGTDEPQFLGLPAEPILETMNLKEARPYVAQLIKERYGVDVPVKRIGLNHEEYGEG